MAEERAGVPPLRGVLETAVYVEDLGRSRAFYVRLLGLEPMVEDHRFCAFGVAGRDVLLLFRRGGTLEPVRVNGGVIPPHDGGGRLHFAFAIAREELDGWERWLQELGIEIESRADWIQGGTSLYF